MAAAASLNLTAVVIGATGPTGSFILAELLKSKEFAKITVLGRRKATVLPEYGIDQEQEESTQRLIQEVVEFDKIDMENAKQYFEGVDVFFSAIGAKKAHVTPEVYPKVHRDYVVKLAGIARECRVKHMLHVSSKGASTGSYISYMKLKGQADEEIQKLKFPHFSCFRPGLLDRGVDESLGIRILSKLFKPMPVKDVAKAMVVTAVNSAKETATGDQEKVEYLDNTAIWKLCSE